MPSAISLPLAKPAVKVYSERVGGRPYVNCMPCAQCSSLRFDGYDVPDDFSLAIRAASGKSTGGLSMNDIKHALAVLLPGHQQFFGQLTNEELLGTVRVAGRPWRRNRTRGVVHVVATMSELPRRLQRHVGFEWVRKHPRGKHALAIAGQKPGLEAGDPQLLILDPMGELWAGYSGQWAGASEVLPALHRGTRGVICSYGVKNSARR